MITKTMLKKTLLFPIALLAGFTAQAQHTFTINGQLAADKQGVVMLYYGNNGKTTVDSATVTNGRFQLKGGIGEPTSAVIDLNPQKGPIRTLEMMKKVDKQFFYLEDTVMTIKSSEGIKTATISGGRSQAEYLLRQAPYASFNEQYNKMGQEMAQYKEDKNDTAVLRIEKEERQLRVKAAVTDSIFIYNHPNSYVAFSIWGKKIHGIAYPDVEKEFNHFTPKIQNSIDGKKIAARLALAKRLNVGNMAPDFTLKDTLGHDVSLASLRGKNVMVCFYSENFMGYETFAFNLGRINRRLSPKNFVMVTVYYDNMNKNTNTVDHWKSVLAASSFNWINLQDIGGYNKEGMVSPTAKAYGIIDGSVLPISFLIGPDGRILSRNPNLADNELALKLEKLLK